MNQPQSNFSAVLEMVVIGILTVPGASREFNVPETTLKSHLPENLQAGKVCMIIVLIFLQLTN